jgi:hypothetical protein
MRNLWGGGVEIKNQILQMVAKVTLYGGGGNVS